ncbi:DNA glycosylase [Pilatotrama ljubarskyi]|nr:DNA glycosylase [Pilatotrama ljubarskyi]
MSRKRKAEVSDSGSEYDDASYEQKKSRKTDVQRKPQTSSRGKRRGSRAASEAIEELDSGLVKTVQARPHEISLHVLSHPELPREALLKWYDGVHAARGMPWRKPYQHSWDPEEKAQRAYEVWVSEIMLQQTQVATVIPYYNRWMERFPTIKDLAASDIDTVNSLWKGLGYYSRAARLLSGAQKAVKEYGGRLPDNAQDMESKIPGIGRYSAGAICSIAYNQCVPVLDGNVHRLLSRLLALHAPPKAKQTLDILWAGASAFVKDAERPGDVNQALIELGSTVCKVRDPACSSCVLQPWCAAYKHQQLGREEDDSKGTKDATSSAGHAVPDIEELCTLCEPLPAGSPVTAYPMKAEKKKAREELDAVNVIEWRRHATSSERWFLLVRRPEGGEPSILITHRDFEVARPALRVPWPPHRPRTVWCGTERSSADPGLLAGLHEFPTAPNVPVTSSSSAHIEIADALLSALLVSPPPARPPATVAGQTARRAPSHSSAGSPGPSPLRVAKIVPAGDVLHIFSHIRKTYRVQWVVLEGGSSEHPPALVQHPEFAALGAAMPKTSKGRAPGKRRANVSADKTRGSSPSSAASSTASAQATQWVRMEAVADANIGTGVMKIWRQVRALWEGGSDGGE